MMVVVVVGGRGGWLGVGLGCGVRVGVVVAVLKGEKGRGEPAAKCLLTLQPHFSSYLYRRSSERVVASFAPAVGDVST